MTELNIRKFDLSKVRGDRAMVLIGASGTGKSHLAASLLHAIHSRFDLQAGIVFCGTHEGDPYWGKHVPESFIFEEFDAEKIEALIALQKRTKSKAEKLREKAQCMSRGEGEQMMKRADEIERASRKCIVLDDVSWDKKMMRQPVMRKLFMMGRHWNLFLMLTLQYAIDLPIELRGNAGYVFCCRENILSYRRRLHEQFFGMVTLPVFQQLFDACTTGYDVLCLDRTVNSNKMEDLVFWHRAPASIPSFRIGSKAMWNYHQRRYDSVKHSNSAEGHGFSKADSKKTAVTAVNKAL